MFRPAFGCAQHPKAGQNTQHLIELTQLTSNPELITKYQNTELKY